MAKKVRKRRQVRRKERGTNWLLIGAVVGAGVIGLFALLFLSLQGQGMPTPTPQPNVALAEHCETNEENCVTKGPAEAPVTIVEVSDYGCGHCRNFNLETAGILDSQYVEAGQVRWIVLPYALRDQSGQYPTLPSTQAAMCASEQGRFFDYHEALFELQTGNLFNTRNGFVQTAESLDMDVDTFTDCLDSDRYRDQILENISAAQSAGVRATPTFFINGRKVEGNLPLANFQQQIESAASS